jgi:hypothetical protein
MGLPIGHFLELRQPHLADFARMARSRSKEGDSPDRGDDDKASDNLKSNDLDHGLPFGGEPFCKILCLYHRIAFTRDDDEAGRRFRQHAHRPTFDIVLG